MATLLRIERVRYLCSCGATEPLGRLYFCRYCLVIRCEGCVAHEVDSVNCPNCLENLPVAEAGHKRNRCHSCWSCPNCPQVLAVRATQVGEKKAFYLACHLCRWTTREAGIPDSPTQGGWPEAPLPNEETLSEVLRAYRTMAQLEKTEREQKKFTKKRVGFGAAASDKYGLKTLIARKRHGLAVNPSVDKDALADLAAVASEEVEELPESIFTEEMDALQVTGLEQRLRQPLTQSADPRSLLPLRKQLSVKHSLRCKECEHNVCKGEYSPGTIKFKIRLLALLSVPDVRIGAEPQGLKAGVPSVLELTISNFSNAAFHVVFLPDVATEEKPGFASVEAPVAEFRVASLAASEAGEEETGAAADDPEAVSFRSGPKLGFRLTVTPKPDHPRDQDLWMSLVMKYDMMDLIGTAGRSGQAEKPEIVWLQQSLKLNLGKLAGE